MVASAAKSLTQRTCTIKTTAAINAAAAVIVYYYSPTWIFPVLLVSGGLVTLIACKNDTRQQEVEDIERLGVGRRIGTALIIIWLVVLMLSVAVRESTSYSSHKELHWFESFYRIGSLIFGGGQVNGVIASLYIAEPYAVDYNSWESCIAVRLYRVSYTLLYRCSEVSYARML